MRKASQAAISRRAALTAIAASPFAARTAARAAERTGLAGVPGGRVWWKRVGGGTKPPLLLLHGGPGMGHDYLLPLAGLAQDREVIFYDQLGCGRSDKPPDPLLYTIEAYAQRLEALRAALGLGQVVLYGHSWGGILAIEYLAGAPRKGVEKLILSGALASAPQANAGIQRLIRAMPDGARLWALERARAYDSGEFADLAEDFNALHFCRADTTPAEFDASMRNASASRCAPIMVGSGLTITGNLARWDRRKDLARIAVPALVVTGEFDEVTRDCHETLRDGLGNARLTVMPRCSHMTMTEAPDAYNAILRSFIG